MLFEHCPDISQSYFSLLYSFLSVTILYEHFSSQFQDVWEEAERYPLYCHLGDKSMYFFSTVSSANNTSYELNDETKRLIDVQPVFCMFRFVEKQVSVNNKLINNITTLLGKTLSEKTLKNPEVNDFRTKMSYLGEDIANKRAVMNRMERIAYQYPPKLVSSQHIPELVKKRITNGDFCVVAKSADMQVIFEHFDTL